MPQPPAQASLTPPKPPPSIRPATPPPSSTAFAAISSEPQSFPWLAQLLQTADPLFPIGSYAHSYGLEELVNAGIVTDPKGLQRYLRDIVGLNLQEFELPYLRFAKQPA